MYVQTGRGGGNPKCKGDCLPNEIYNIEVTTPMLYIGLYAHTCLALLRNVDFGELLSDEAKKRHKYTHYDLLSNIVHDGEPKSGVYLAHVLHKVCLYVLNSLNVTGSNYNAILMLILVKKILYILDHLGMTDIEVYGKFRHLDHLKKASCFVT